MNMGGRNWRGIREAYEQYLEETGGYSANYGSMRIVVDAEGVPDRRGQTLYEAMIEAQKYR